MKTKIRALLGLERIINLIAKPLRLRVLLVPDSSLHQMPVTFRTDGLITSHHVNFHDEPFFAEVLDKVRAQVAHSTYHEFRMYVAMHLAQRVRDIPGMIVECGAGEGAFALAILMYTGYDQPMVLFDTFSGIDPALLSESEHAKYGQTAEERSASVRAKAYSTNSLEEVSARFKSHANVTLIKGSVPSILRKNLDRLSNITLLHIDMNTAMPEAEALKMLYAKVTVPGFILFDDYGFEILCEQRAAVDDACRELGIDKPMSLPTGQGLIIKTH